MKQVKVDLLLVESDQTVKAILALMPVLNITKLVLRTTKLSLRYNIQLYNNNEFTPPRISNPNLLEFGFGRNERGALEVLPTSELCGLETCVNTSISHHPLLFLIRILWD
jgi:hypothetical protein